MLDPNSSGGPAVDVKMLRHLERKALQCLPVRFAQVEPGGDLLQPIEVNIDAAAHGVPAPAVAPSAWISSTACDQSRTEASASRSLRRMR